MALTKEQTEAWIAALRSGNYNQCSGSLYSLGSFCCLGVLSTAVLNAPVEVLEKFERGSSGIPEKFSPYLAENLPEGPLPMQFWELNDDQKLSFDEIADFIERNYI